MAPLTRHQQTASKETKMPLYTIMCPQGIIDDAGRERLATDITKMHVHMAGVPDNWVHVIFQDFAPNHGFTAGRPADVVSLTLLIRDGRSSDYKRTMLVELWRLLQDATGAPDDQIVIGIQEVPASQAMEMGKIMPDVDSA
jgi:phenylpyruvate tautomerase PptA (4-oxalocrotonate tautomerase family)